MGLFKQIITHVVVKKANESLMERVAEALPCEDKSKARKAPLFKSRRDLAEAAAIYFFSMQIFYIIILMMCQLDNMSWGAFYRACAMASLVAWSVLFVGMLAYGLYRIDLLPLLFMLVLLVLVVALLVIPLGFEYGYGIYKDFFLGTWLNPAVTLVLFLLGIITIAVTLAIVIYYENGGAKKKTQKQAPPPVSNEEAENNRKSLKSAIKGNAINVRFLRRKWNFTTSAVVLFGYDEQNKQFVFVSDQNSYTLSCKKVVYLDFEDVESDPNAAINTSEYQRLIKLYYLGSSKKEHILSLAQVHISDEAINRIKYYANNNSSGSSEIVFRRKIRHLASALEKEFYPCRPFANDEWFDLLKECMEKIKNSNTDGYSLFREQVIAAEDYMDDEVLSSIICDLSIDPPDRASAKKEARRLCLHDFGATLNNNIKSSVKGFFSNNK